MDSLILPKSKVCDQLFTNLRDFLIVYMVSLFITTKHYFLPPTGFNNFSSFNKLETLNLSVTHFGNKILSSLNGLNSLKTLRLSGNRLNGSMTLLG